MEMSNHNYGEYCDATSEILVAVIHFFDDDVCEEPGSTIITL